MGLFGARVHLFLHKFFRMAIAGDIADGEINTFFYDHFIATDIRHVYFVFVRERPGTVVFAFYGIHQDLIGLFRKGKEAQLRIIKSPLDEMELDKHFLTQQFGAVEKDLMIFKIVDVF